MGTIFPVIINFFEQVLYECTEGIVTSLITLDIILSDICAYIIGFSCTVWTKMRSFAYPLADGVVHAAISFSPAQQQKEGKGVFKKFGNR